VFLKIFDNMKHLAKKLIRIISPQWEQRLRDQWHFHRLSRRPPEWMWTTCAPCPVERVEAAGVQIGHELFVMGGYRTIDEVLNLIDVFDLKKRKWTRRLGMPSDIPQTHQGATTDGQRYIYSVAGQLGAQCSPAVANAFVLDTQTKTWKPLPALPEPRYAPTVKYWRGRLHAIGGLREDRNTPCNDHWSIAVETGKALEPKWRPEPPIPLSGTHRASAVVDDRLYVLGSQQGDFKPIPCDPNYTCDWETPLEHTFGETYMLKPGADHWTKMSGMPVNHSHTEYSVLTFGRKIAILGGEVERYKFSDLIQVYDTQTDSWAIVGHLPYLSKGRVCAYYNGWVFIATGQRSGSAENPRPGEVLNSVWRAKFS